MTGNEDALRSLYERLRKCDAKGLDAKAVAVCDKILKAETDAKNVREVLKTKCVCLLRQQKLEAALALAQKEEFRLEEAFVLYKQKHSKEALALLDQVNPAESKSPASVHLRAQLLHRMGSYEEARAVYADLVGAAGSDAMSELVANFLASSVLAGSADGVMEVLGHASLAGRRASGEAFELLYNKACALLAVGDAHGAAEALAEALELGQAFLETDERLTDANVAAELAILRVQRAYALQQALASSASAPASDRQDADAETLDLLIAALAANSSDKAVPAVAANNLLALRGEHEVFDSFKRMRTHAADPASLDALPRSSQQTLAVNRALLLLKMNKTRECRKLLEELRAGDFADLPELDLVEAVLLEQDGKPTERDALLETRLDTAVADGKLDRAAKLALARAQTQLAVGEVDAALATLRDRPALRAHPAVLAAALALCQHAGREAEADALLADDAAAAASSSAGADGEVRVAMLQAEVATRRGDPARAAEVYESVLTGKFGPVDGDVRMEALANYVTSAASFDTDAAEAKAKALPMPAGVDEVDVEALEAGLLKAKARPRHVRSVAASSDVGARSPAAENAAAAEDAAKKLRSLENKRKKELKKRAKRREAHLANLRERNGPDFDPAKQKVDPERWIPKNMRQAALKARKKRGAKLTGAQGGGAVNSKEAARLDARAGAAATSTAAPAPSSTRSKKRGKKGRR